MDILSQEIAIVIVGTVFFLVLAVGIVVLILIYQKKQLRYILQKKELENEYQNQILSVQLEAREQTLKMVAMEVHDNVGQALSFAKLNLNKVAEPMPAIHTAKELITKAIQDLRTLSKTLNSDYIAKTPLYDCLAFDVNLIQQSNAMQASLTVEGESFDLAPQTKLIVYRMAQELLNNAVRHSEASQVTVLLSHENQRLVLRVEDNGKGLCDLAGHAQGTGLGNLKTRADMIKGVFQLSNVRPSGTRAELVLPLS